MKHRACCALMVVTTICCAWSTASAFGSGDDRGTAGFKGLQMISDARTWGLARSTTALAGNPMAYATNPAAAATIQRTHAVFSATSHLLGILPVGGTVVRPTGSGVWTLAINGLDYGSFDRIDGSANIEGTFGAGDFMMHVGWARTLGRGFSAGASAGWVRSSIADWSASAAVFSFGLLWQSPGNATTVGVAATNLGTALSAYMGGDDGMKDSVPSELHVGVTHRPAHFPLPLMLLADVVLPRDNEATLNVGAEIKAAEILSLRVGYNALVRYQSLTDGDSGTQTKITLDDRESGGFGGLGLNFGAGVIWRDYGADYSYTMAGTFGGIHSVTLRFAL